MNSVDTSSSIVTCQSCNENMHMYIYYTHFGLSSRPVASRIKKSRSRTEIEGVVDLLLGFSGPGGTWLFKPSRP